MTATCVVEGCEDESRAKAMCQKHYLRVKNYGDPHAYPRFYASGKCEVEGCGTDTKKRGRYCSTHRSRIERNGHTDLLPRSERHAHTEGYVMVKSPDHPLAQKTGWIMEHRAVLYDSIGGGVHPCHWCSRPVQWVCGRSTRDSLVVDHLDDDRTNNRLENLAPSCTTCNSGRATHWGKGWNATHDELRSLSGLLQSAAGRDLVQLMLRQAGAGAV